MSIHIERKEDPSTSHRSLAINSNSLSVIPADTWNSGLGKLFDCSICSHLGKGVVDSFFNIARYVNSLQRISYFPDHASDELNE